MLGSRVKQSLSVQAHAPLQESTKLPLACGLAIATALLIVIPYRILQGGYLTDVSGAWAALADDLAHGVLYRPLISELGYGGTRYFPLHIVVHGALVALGLSVRVAGHVVSLASAVVLVVAGARVLKARGATREFAWAGALLTLAARTSFMAVAGVRGDLIAVALGVLGLSFIPLTAGASLAVTPAAICFALALLAKPTLAWAPAGAFIALVLGGQIRAAAKLTVLVSVLTVGGMALAQFASHGEMLTSFRAFGSGGGFSLHKLIGSMSFVRPGEALWILGGVVATLLRPSRGVRDPIGAAALICLLVTLVLYTGEGIHTNHLIDSVVIGALAIGSAVATLPAARWPTILWGVAAVLGTLEAVTLDGMVLARGDLERAAAAIPAGTRPMLSEQPWIPVVAGERPFLMDAFNLAHLRVTSPVAHRDLLDRLDQCRFRAVLLIGRTKPGDWWYENARFGVGFSDHLLDHYVFSGVVGAHAIYLPRCGLSPDQFPKPLADLAGDDTVINRGGRPNAVKVMLGKLLHL